ncbi:MAG: YifB family Mg chelatase-like AAA ATPase [SAR324 cluster bacterium]|nr:YifB family Mg chelatase-like AAA ATPase [SAR324 cluster bacterium]
MATAIAITASILGVDAHVIEVEADVSIGLGAFNIVGLPDGPIRESKDRITAAVNNSGAGFPIKKVIVNLAPADLPKGGTGFDLPMALAILEASEKLPQKSLKEYLIVGELSLEGKLRAVNGVLAMALAAKKAGIKAMIVPKKSAPAASLVQGVAIFPAASLNEVLDHLNGYNMIQPYVGQGNITEPPPILLDFADVKGQNTAKRSLEIAAAGRHNLLFSGPPGSGKSMLAKRLSGILPPMSFSECLETTKIHGIAGRLSPDEEHLQLRPFQSPHHSVSGAGLIGGGTIPKPGEVSLAHNGVLFLDELPEYPRQILDLLRQPLEDKKVTISRAKESLTFPTDFVLIAAMNPCPCGYLGDSVKSCRCPQAQVERYRTKVSGPLMDRIDMQVEMPALSYEEMNFSKQGESSLDIRERVLKARAVQELRFGDDASYNANMSHKEVEKYCALNESGHKLLKSALTKHRLSGRAHDSILKVSRTIADLSGEETIQLHHLAESISYRCLDKEVNY